MNSKFFSWSLLSSFSSSALALFSECTARMLSSTLPLNHYLGHTNSTSITISWKVSVLSPGVPNFLNNSNSQCQGPISYQMDHLTTHRRHPASAPLVCVSRSESAASCLLILSSSLTVTSCEQ